MKKLFTVILGFSAAVSSLAVQREYFVGVEYDEISEMPIKHGAQYYDNIIKDKYIWELSFDEWFNGPHFSGGWVGIRKKLENRGFVLTLVTSRAILWGETIKARQTLRQSISDTASTSPS